jgi:hypothetical protein
MKLVVTETTDGYEECVHTSAIMNVTTLQSLNQQVIHFVADSVELVWTDSYHELKRWLKGMCVEPLNFSLSGDVIDIDATSITERDFFKFLKEWNSEFKDSHTVMLEIIH